MKRFLIVPALLLSFSTLLTAQSRLEWEDIYGLDYADEGFVKTASNGWENNLANTNDLSIGTDDCFIVDPGEFSWADFRAFKLGFGATNMQTIEDANPIILIDDETLKIDHPVDGTLNLSISSALLIKFEIINQKVKVFVDGVEKFAFSQNLPTDFVFAFAMEDYGNFQEDIFYSCDASGNSIIPACQGLTGQKYTESKSYAPDGTQIGHNIDVVDNYGRKVQSLYKNFAADRIIASQAVYDRFGRQAIQSLPAPIAGSSFCYDPAFMLEPTYETSYSHLHFDKPETNLDQLGEVDNPITVSPNSTLGKYYSNNGEESHTATSSYPYTRSTYENSITDEVRKTSGLDGYRINGSGRETYNFNMISGTELDYVYGIAESYFTSVDGSPLSNDNRQLFKKINKTPDGEWIVSYSNSDEQVVATCRSDNGSSCIDQISRVRMEKDAAVRIHVPQSETGNISIRFPDPWGAYDNILNPGAPVTYCISCFDITIYDEFTKTKLVEGTDYTLTESTSNKRVYDVNLLGTYASKSGVYSFTYDLTAQAQTAFYEFLQFEWINLDPVIIQNLDYNNWQLYYYDARGNLTRTIQPEGVNCNYDAGNGTKDSDRHNLSATNLSDGDVIYTIDYDHIAGNNHSLKINMHPTAVFQYIDHSATTYGDPCGNFWDHQYQVHTVADPFEPTETIEGSFNHPSTLGKKSDFAEAISPYTTNTPNLQDAGGINFFKGEKAPDPIDPDNWDRTITRRFKTKYSLKVYGLTTGGAQTLLQTIAGDFMIEYYDYARIASDGTREFRREEKIFGNLGGSPLTDKDHYIYDELILDDTDNLDQYYKIVIKMDDVEMFDGVQTYACDGDCGDVTLTAEPSYVGVCRFSVFGIMGFRFSSTPPSIAHHHLQESYRYDNRDLLISKTLPDEGKTEMVYNSRGLLRFSQNAQQKLDDQFSYVIYDNALRPVESGVYQNYNGSQQAPPGVTDMDFSLTAPIGAHPANVHDVKDQKDGLNDANGIEVSYTLYDVAAADLPAPYSTNFTQNYIRGRVSKTWNQYSKTWYSYDYRGLTEWMIVWHTDLGYKTFRYTYDQLGQLTAVDMNELDTGEDFYIKYEYNSGQQMTGVYSSNDPSTGFLKQVSYEYDLLGRIVRKELGVKYQGIDYVYTIDGKIKSINNASTTQTDDPGQDGVTATDHYNSFPDLFAETLSYFDGDYVRQNSKIQTLSNSNGPDQYGGRIKASTWVNNTGVTLPNNPGSRMTYAYQYDSRGQLSQAVFGTSTAGSQNGATGSGSAPVFTPNAQNEYKVFGVDYDLNGNITALERNGYGSQISMDELTYEYDLDAGHKINNRLRYVADGSSSTAYASELQTQSAGNYTYNALGRLTGDAQQDLFITYNARGLVERVQNAAKTQNKEFTEYDERGYPIKKHIYSGGSLIAYEYRIFDAGGSLALEYREDIQASKPLEATKAHVYGLERVSTADISLSDPEYHYEVKDHIGNVRASFRNDQTVAIDHAFNNTLNGWTLRNTTTYSYPTTGVKLMGDGAAGVVTTFNLSANTRYTVRVRISDANAQELRCSMLEASTSAKLFKMTLKEGLNEVPFYNNSNSSVAIHIFIPAASAATGSYFTLEEVKIIEDQLEVLKYADYYPFGWEIPGRTYTSAAHPNDFGYQGDFSRKNDQFNWNEFQLRNYDSRIGRWTTVDPAGQYFSPYLAMGNNPISMVDPDGAWSNVWDPGGILGSESYYQAHRGGDNPINSMGDLAATNPGFAYSDEGTIWGNVLNSLIKIEGDPAKKGKRKNEPVITHSEYATSIPGTIFMSTFGLDGHVYTALAQDGQFTGWSKLSLRDLGISRSKNATSVSLPSSVSIGMILREIFNRAPVQVLGRTLLFSSAIGTTLTMTGDKGPELIKLYRGVHADHPDISNALLGIATPMGGRRTRIEHTRGKNNSIFTSWTISEDVANYHANKEGLGGVVLQKTFKVGRGPGEAYPTPIPYEYWEGEWLVPGVVTGAKAAPPTGPGIRSLID